MSTNQQCVDCLTKYVNIDLCRGCRYMNGDRSLPSMKATQSTIYANKQKERNARYEADRKERERLMNERMAKAKLERDERMRKMEEQRQERMVQMKLRQERDERDRKERLRIHEEEQRKNILEYREELGAGPEISDAQVLRMKLDLIYKEKPYLTHIDGPADADPSLVRPSRVVHTKDSEFVEVLGEIGKGLHKSYLNCEKGYKKVINWFNS